jgi:UDP-glucose 4-epimerase
VRVLVTGSGGFIGRALAEGLRTAHEVSAPSRAELDLLDEQAVYCYLRRHSFDAVVHAATVRANRKIGAPAGLLHHNCRMFFNLARNEDTFGRLLNLSSGAAYDRRYPAPLVTEDHFGQRVPADDYGFSKYICGQFIPTMRDAYDLRLFGVFGPHEDWEIRFLSNACCRAVWDLPIVFRQNVNFDYTDVADVARVVQALLEITPEHRAYNVCSGRPVSLASLASMVVHASGKRLPIVVKQDGMGEEYSGDSQRLQAELPGFHFRELQDSIEELYRWYARRKPEIDSSKLNFDA